MVPGGEALAKLSRPRLHDPLPRPRLFERLDAMRARKGIWIAAPPGAGKTTLVASYLDNRKLPALWYQVDDGDLDPAAFFVYLRQAARQFAKGKRAASLPLLRPEYLTDLPGFARRFFRALYALLPPYALFVLDNAQHLAQSAAMDNVLAEAIGEAPAALCVVVISRLPAAETHSRTLANRDMAILQWEDLRFDREETRRIAAHYAVGAEEVSRIYEQAAGWAAGLMLLLEGGVSAQRDATAASEASRQKVFDYFAAQIFSQYLAEDQRVLLYLGVLPRMTASVAQALTGSTRAPRILEQLYQRQLFVYRRQGTLGHAAPHASQERIYEFHALFRAFLQDRMAARDSEEVLAVHAHAAQLMEDCGAVEDAVEQYALASRWERIDRLVQRHAETLIAQGRGQSVLDWCRRIPQEHIAGSARLLYWRGIAQLAAQPAAARADLEHAYARARSDRDSQVDIEAAAAIVETYFYEYSHFTQLDRWTPILREFLEKDPAFESAEAGLRIWLAFLDALMVRPVAQEMLPATLDKVFELASTVRDKNLAASAARTLILCCTHTVRLQMARQVALFVEPLLDHPDVLPMTRAMSYFAMSWMSVQARDYERGMRCVGQMEALARDRGMPQLARLGHYMGGLLELFHGNLQAAHARADNMERTMFANHPYDVASYLALRGWIAAVERKPGEVLNVMPEAIRLFDQVGSSLQRQGQRSLLHWAHMELGQFEKAEAAMEDASAVASVVGYQRQGRITVGVTRACIAKRRADYTEMCAALRELLSEAREFGYECWLQWFPGPMSELCPEALAAGIETDYVRRLIRENDWKPTRADIEDWPWRVRIHTLGRFGVEVDGKPLAFERKTPRKVLALLKALVAFGGSGVSQQRLIDALWPDEEADAALAALTVALKRLRALLGDHELIAQSGKELSLDRTHCWVDVWAFDEGVQRVAEQGDLDRVLRLYGGNFLEAEGDLPWTIATREPARTVRPLRRSPREAAGGQRGCARGRGLLSARIGDR